MKMYHVTFGADLGRTKYCDKDGWREPTYFDILALYKHLIIFVMIGCFFYKVVLVIAISFSFPNDEIPVLGIFFCLHY